MSLSPTALRWLDIHVKEVLDTLLELSSERRASLASRFRESVAALKLVGEVLFLLPGTHPPALLFASDENQRARIETALGLGKLLRLGWTKEAVEAGYSTS